MKLIRTPVSADGVKIVRRVHGKEVGRAYLYVLKNDLHDRPFGFMEDVYVDVKSRGAGIGEALVLAVIAEARRRGCYKLVATSRTQRDRVHALYARLGFKDWGKEFRIDF